MWKGINIHCHCPTSVTVTTTSRSCNVNAPLATSNKCSSALSEDKTSPASGATAASGATVTGVGGSSFFWLLVLLVGVAEDFLGGGGMDLVAGDMASGENAVAVGEAAMGDAEGIESLNIFVNGES